MLPAGHLELHNFGKNNRTILCHYYLSKTIFFFPFLLLAQKKWTKKKRAAWVIWRPTTGSIPKPVKPFGKKYSRRKIIFHRTSLLRLAFDGIFAEWVPAK
jgi:hypothetical protein